MKYLHLGRILCRRSLVTTPSIFSSKREVPPQSDLAAKTSGLGLEDVSVDTAIVTARLNFSGTPTIPLVPPIYHSSTYILESAGDFLEALKDGGYVYSRLSNLTSDTAECAINVLEKGAGTVTFSSGMGAVSAVLFGFLKSGDHIICQNPVYSGTFDLIKQFAEKFNIQASWVEAGCPVEEYRKQIKANTRILWGETPCNPNMTILDLKAFGELGQAHPNIITVVDGTFGSPYLQQILKYGIDISMQSCTKYIGGHSDLIGGCLTVRTTDQWRVVKKMQGSIGACMSPHDASLVLRGLRTLPLRMMKHSQNALKVAQFLERHPKVLKVNYPGLPSHPGHEIAKRQMKAFSGMIMAEVKGGSPGGVAVVENVRLSKLAVSLGGVETIIEHPYSMTHGPYLLSEEETKDADVTPGMLRIR